MSLKNILRDSGLVKAGPDPVRVLVRLKPGAGAEPGALERLRGLGLEIEQTLDSTLIGRIPAAGLEALRADPAVEAVEPSTEMELKR